MTALKVLYHVLNFRFGTFLGKIFGSMILVRIGGGPNYWSFVLVIVLQVLNGFCPGLGHCRIEEGEAVFRLMVEL